jgi:hypothetical protein
MARSCPNQTAVFFLYESLPAGDTRNNSVISRKTSKIPINDDGKTQPAGITLQEVQGWLTAGETLTCQGIEADASRYMLG